MGHSERGKGVLQFVNKETDTPVMGEFVKIANAIRHDKALQWRFYSLDEFGDGAGKFTKSGTFGFLIGSEEDFCFDEGSV